MIALHALVVFYISLKYLSFSQLPLTSGEESGIFDSKSLRLSAPNSFVNGCKQCCEVEIIYFRLGHCTKSLRLSAPNIFVNGCKQCCEVEIIYFRLRLLFGSTLFHNFGSSSGSSPIPVLVLKKLEIFGFNNIKTILQK